MMTTKTNKVPNAFTTKPDLSGWVREQKIKNQFSKNGSKQATTVKTTGAGDFVLRPVSEKR